MFHRGGLYVSPASVRIECNFTMTRLITSILALAAISFSQAPPSSPRTNDPAAVELFRDRGLGLFIHWSVDGALGGVISHSLVGASPDYVDRFFRILPEHFNPDRFQPEKWASLAKLAGFEYVMFTAKHHSGFACGTPRPRRSASVTRPTRGSHREACRRLSQTRHRNRLLLLAR